MSCGTQAVPDVQNQPGIRDRVKSALDAAQDQRDIMEGARDAKAKEHTLSGGQPTIVHAAAAGAFNTLAVAAVTLIVVVFVVGQIDESMSMDSESEFYESYETVISTTGSAFDLAAVALIVLVASVILWYVSGFGSNGNRLR